MSPFKFLILLIMCLSGSFPLLSAYKIDNISELNSCPPGIPENEIPDSILFIFNLNLGKADFLSEKKFQYYLKWKKQHLINLKDLFVYYDLNRKFLNLQFFQVF